MHRVSITVFVWGAIGDVDLIVREKQRHDSWYSLHLYVKWMKCIIMES